MRRILFIGLAATAALAPTSSSFALEKRALCNPVDADAWDFASTCQIMYFNTCTTWVWAWTGWAPSARVGVTSGRCLNRLLQTATYQVTDTPTGYGFTGTIAVYNTDASHCPTGAPLASQPWLSSGNGVDISLLAHNWWVDLPINYALVYTFGPAPGNPTAIITDHPSAGPTGPAACGNCYSTSRVNHSFRWGPASTPVCPGAVFDDDSGCTAQMCVIAYEGEVIAVEPRSWGGIKALYR